MSDLEEAVEAVLSHRETVDRCASAPVVALAGGEERDEGVRTLLYPEYRAEVEGFFSALGEFLMLWKPAPGDYIETSRALRDDHHAVGSAGPDDLKALLTFVWRGERFRDGFWEVQLQSGLVTATLDRLHELHRAGRIRRVDDRP